MKVDLLNAFSTPPPPADFIWPGFLAGTVGALVAPGATGKSFWATEAVMCVSADVAGADLLGLDVTHHGRVVYFAGEDPVVELTRRIHAIGAHLSTAAREEIAARLDLESTLGARLDIMNEAKFEEICGRAEGARLVVFDTLSRIHQMDENSNGDMSRLVSQLEALAVHTGAAVLFLHHVSKGSAMQGQADQQQAARGASSLIDNARWCGFVARMSATECAELSADDLGHPIGADERKKYMKFGGSKVNYSEGAGVSWYQRVAGGVLRPVSLTSIEARAPRRRKGIKREQA